jgi:hypothetical protein
VRLRGPSKGTGEPVGLAGTILVTGIAPVMVASLGASSIPPIIIITPANQIHPTQPVASSW